MTDDRKVDDRNEPAINRNRNTISRYRKITQEEHQQFSTIYIHSP